MNTFDRAHIPPGKLSFSVKRRGGPTPFLYMATRFLPNVHVQKCTKMYKIGFFMFGSSLDRFTCCG